MKKTLIALAAVSALAAVASGAEAHGYRSYYYGGYGNHHGNYNNYYHNDYESSYSTYQPECHYVTIKRVVWEYGYRVVKYKQKLVCDSDGY
jgi:hypothetical protein